MNADLLNLDSASCPRPSGRKVLRTEYVTTSAYIRDEFRSGGGGGAEVSCPNIFSIACTKIKCFCPNIT